MRLPCYNTLYYATKNLKTLLLSKKFMRRVNCSLIPFGDWGISFVKIPAIKNIFEFVKTSTFIIISLDQFLF